jgi:hypothetical protein
METIISKENKLVTLINVLTVEPTLNRNSLTALLKPLKK